MGYARNLTIPGDITGIYHCFSRCVRSERLIESPGRVAVLERRLAFLSTRVFAIDLIEFKPMGSHVHLMIRNHPELAWCWTDEEVARRWLRLSLAGRNPDLEGVGEPADEAVHGLLQDDVRVAELRRRMSDLGWYHSAWKEWTARRWNREDRKEGHFWQGRYGVTTGLDDSAVLAQAVYVLLNAVHAGLESELIVETAGSMQTRIKRCMRQVAGRGRERGGDAGFQAAVDASWTPVYPCDAGSAADLDEEEFARRVAAGRHQASLRAAVREDARNLASFATKGEPEEVQRVAWELRGREGGPVAHEVPEEPQSGPRDETATDDLSTSPSALVAEGVPPHRQRPARSPRHRAVDVAHRIELKDDERGWLTSRRNPFHRTRLVDGAVPVMEGMTLGALIALADEEGRYSRPDKSGSIAIGAPRALARLWQIWNEGDAGWASGATDSASSCSPPNGVDAIARLGTAAMATVGGARRITTAIRERVIALAAVGRCGNDAANEDGDATTPTPGLAAEAESASSKIPRRFAMRGTVVGLPESLDREARRRQGTCVHPVRAVLRE